MLCLRNGALDSDVLDCATADAEAWVDPSNGLRKIAGYAAQLQRFVERNTTRLEAMQAQRKSALRRQAGGRRPAHALAEAKGQTYDPAPDFPSATEGKAAAGKFVYSAPERARLIDRATRLQQAKTRSLAA